MKKYNVFIVGGGASGLCCAVYIKLKNPKITVALAEQLPRVGKKLIVTGNGRCNITNSDERKNRFHSNDIEAVMPVIEKYNNKRIESFFEKIGVVFTYSEDKKAYPNSLQASSVVDALRFSCEETGVEILTDTKILSYKKAKDCFEISSENDVFYSDNIVIATGLYSGGKKLGSDGNFFSYMKSRGYKSVPVNPAIVQLKTDNALTRSLKGIKTVCAVKLVSGNKTVRTDFGEVLFCDYGLSGPPIMQISGSASIGMKVALDLLPDLEYGRLFDMLVKRKENLKNRPAGEFFTGFLNKRVGQAVIKLCGYDLSIKVSELKNTEKICKTLKGLEFTVKGNTGFENSQVTSGGLKITEFDMKSFESKKEKGVFAIGEILDLNGDCGGFNLHFAWSSAFCCGDEIIKRSKGIK